MALASLSTGALIKYRATRLAIAERYQRKLDMALWDDPTLGYWTDDQIAELRRMCAGNWRRVQEIDAIIGDDE